MSQHFYKSFANLYEYNYFAVAREGCQVFHTVTAKELQYLAMMLLASYTKGLAIDHVAPYVTELKPSLMKGIRAIEIVKHGANVCSVCSSIFNNLIQNSELSFSKSVLFLQIIWINYKKMCQLKKPKIMLIIGKSIIRFDRKPAG